MKGWVLHGVASDQALGVQAFDRGQEGLDVGVDLASLVHWPHHQDIAS